MHQHYRRASAKVNELLFCLFLLLPRDGVLSTHINRSAEREIDLEVSLLLLLRLLEGSNDMLAGLGCRSQTSWMHLKTDIVVTTQLYEGN